MRDWLPQDDIVHLVLDAVSLMDLAKYEEQHRVDGVGQAPFAPEMLLTLLIYAYSHGVKSNRAIERLCRRDAGYRCIVSKPVPDHTVMPKGLSARGLMHRKLRTKRGRAIYAQRGASVEPVFGQMKDRQGPGQFSMRGLAACQGEWHLHAAAHNLRKLHWESVRRRKAGSQMPARQPKKA